MSDGGFVHLRVHSAYSLSEGALKIGPLVELCRKNRMPAVALTDSANLFGALEFALAAAAGGVQPIIGCQLPVAREDAAERLNGGARRPRHDAIVLLAQDETGYRNLCKLSSKGYLGTAPGEEPHVRLGDLHGCSAGLIALTGGPDGAVGRLLAEGQLQAAREMLEGLEALFPGRLYIELMRHGLEVEARIEGDLIELAYERGLPLVATNDAHFADETMFEAHDALLCIADGVHVAADDRRRLTPEHRFKNAAEMRALFADLPEAVDNTLVVARRCAFMPTVHKPILPPYRTPDGVGEEEALRRMAREGLASRLERHVFAPGMDAAAREAAAAPYRERLEFELGVIAGMGYPGYFLIVADFIQWAKAHGIPVGPGRGSGAGSVVAWALTITDLDPLRFGLLFERFLNPDRVSMPDFDIDFCQDRRDEVIHYVQDKYGADKVAQIITFGKLQARAAIRDVGRVLGMPYGQVDKISKLVPYNPAKPVGLAQAIESEPELQRLRSDDEQVARLLDIALRLEGLYRHASTHAAGVVIGDRPLDELLPLYRDPRSDMAATQFSMKYTELAGLVKFDFLGLKTLTMIDRAVALLHARGVAVDMTALPLADPATYAMLGRGETVGVFQLESAGMRDVLRHMKPDCFEDIIALVALYRPGPMDNIPRYIACKHGREEPDYLHPMLEGILKETSGVIVYQEQVMRIAQELAGFSLAAADLLRRAMGKKIKSEMTAQRQTFVDGAIARGVAPDTAARIFDQVAKFADYGFNKSHAAAYALVAFQTAWLKANHPVEFLAASMSLDMGNTDKLNLFRQELDRLGIPLLPPDINRSGVEFTVDTAKGQGAIRYALAAIRNVGTQAMREVVAERESAGPFHDAFDFAERMGGRVANKRQLENLVRAGAFDALDGNRRQLFRGIETLIRVANSAGDARASQQANLFAGDGAAAGHGLALPEIEDWPNMQRLANEFDAIGFYLSAHPLDGYGGALRRLGVVPSAALGPGGPTNPKLAGVVLRRQERTSAKGNRFAYVTLSDTGGVYEVLLFAELLAETRGWLEPGAAALVTAEARIDGEGLRLTAQRVEKLEDAVARAASGLKLYVEGADSFTRIQALLDGGRTGKGRIHIVLGVGAAQEVEIALPGRYAISGALRHALGALPGVVEVQDA